MSALCDSGSFQAKLQYFKIFKAILYHDILESEVIPPDSYN